VHEHAKRVADSQHALKRAEAKLVEIIEPMERENDVAVVKQMFERARPLLTQIKNDVITAVAALEGASFSEIIEVVDRAQELLRSMSDEVEDRIEAMIKSSGRELSDEELITLLMPLS
jgi:hypothetical protein